MFYWMIMGALFVLMAVGYRYWAQDLGLRMTWWKWTITILWYALLVLTIAAPLTIAGENEIAASGRIAIGLGFVTLVLGIGVARLVLGGRKPA